MATVPTKARKRMDKLMRHLTSDAPPDMPDSVNRLRLRREMASSQRERVMTDYRYEFKDQEHEPLFGLDEYLDTCEDQDEEEEDNSHIPPSYTLIEPTTTNNNITIAACRNQLSKACRIASKLGVAGDSLDDCASCLVPGLGCLFKPMGIRFSEITPQTLMLIPIKDLPKLHSDLYKFARANGNTPMCVFSIRNADCELVSISRDGFLPLCQDALRLYGNIQRVDEENLELRASRPTYRNIKCWLVRNHGALCCADTIPGALANLVWTVRACAFQTRAMLAVGGDLKRLDLLSHSEALKAKTDIEVRHSNASVAQHIFDTL